MEWLLQQGWNTSVAVFGNKSTSKMKLILVLRGSLVQQEPSVYCEHAEESGAITTIQ